MFISKKQWDQLVKRVEVLEEKKTSTPLQEIKKAVQEAIIANQKPSHDLFAD